MRISDWSSDVCSSDLSADRNRGDWGLLLRLAGLADAGESVVNRSDQPRTIADFDLVVRHMRRNDVSRQSNEILVAPRFLAHSPAPAYRRIRTYRQSVVSGKSVSVRVDLGGRGIIKKKTKK